MEAARAVLRRLERIEALEREGAPPEQVLAEVRELLHEGEQWLLGEGAGSGRAAEALDRCRRAHESGVVSAV
jgi:hypothetical protein